jgi:hypothetical protein
MIDLASWDCQGFGFAALVLLVTATLLGVATRPRAAGPAAKTDRGPRPAGEPGDPGDRERDPPVAWHLGWGDGPLAVSWVAAPGRSATERACERVAEHEGSATECERVAERIGEAVDRRDRQRPGAHSPGALIGHRTVHWAASERRAVKRTTPTWLRARS